MGGVIYVRILGWIMLALGVYYIGIAVLFCFPQNRANAYGKLEKTKSKKNVWVRKDRTVGSGKIEPHYTEYVYNYTVGSKSYRISDFGLVTPRQLPRSPRIVYLKQIPGYSFIPQMTVFKRPWWGLFLVILGGGFLLVT